MVKQQKYADAKSLFEKAEKLSNSEPIIKNNLGVIALKDGDLAKAEDAYKRIIVAKPGASIDMVATIRLARLQAEQGNVGTALQTLESVTDAAYVSQREELKGDFLVRQGDLVSAKQAYQTAIDNGGALTNPALTIKLDNLNKA